MTWIPSLNSDTVITVVVLAVVACFISIVVEGMRGR